MKTPQEQLDRDFKRAGFERTTTGGGVGALVRNQLHGVKVFVADFGGEGLPISGEFVTARVEQNDRPEPFCLDERTRTTSEAFLRDLAGPWSVT